MGKRSEKAAKQIMANIYNSDLPIILLPGMGADWRVFEGVTSAVEGIVVPEWIAPIEGESIGEYAKRWAEKIDPDYGCFIGGASFGGFVALEMARHLDAKTCFLIGSVRGPEELPERIKALTKLCGAAGILPFELAKMLSKIGLLSSGSLSAGNVKELLKQMSDSDAEFMKWACWAVLNWKGEVDTAGVPVYHIHGEKDFVLPVKNTSPDVIVKGGGHLISISHAKEVSDFLVNTIRIFCVQ